MPAPRRPAGAAVLQEDKTAAIVEAGFAELAEAGWQGVSMDRIAARACVGKAALYRRWPSKDALLLDLIVQVGSEHEPPDTGSVRGDLVAYLDDTLRALADPIVARLVPDILAQTQRSPDLAEEIRTRFREPRRAALRLVLTRAVERGELPPDADVELGLDLLAGPLMLQAVGTGRTLPDDYAERVVAATLRAISST